MGAAEKDIQVEIAEDFDALAAMQSQWDAFMEAVGGEVFLTYDWCRIWWKYYGGGRELKIFIFRHQGDIVGILPLFFEKVRLGPVSVRIAKIVTTDFGFTTVSVPIRKEFLDAVVQIFYECMRHQRWDIIHIGPVAGIYPYFEELQAVCARYFLRPFRIKAADSDVHSYLTVPSSWEELFSGLSKNQRESIKRSYKKVSKIEEAEKATLVSESAKPNNFNEFFDGFIRMHQTQWQMIGKLGHFGDWPFSREFHREVAEAQMKHDRLRLLKIRIGNICLGYSYNYIFNRAYYNLLTARSELDAHINMCVGNVIFRKEITAACADHVKYLDWMPGRYDYKLRFGAKYYQVRNLYISRCDLCGCLRVRLFHIFASFLHLCYYRIWFLRMAPRLPFKRGSLWKIWIRTRGLA